MGGVEQAMLSAQRSWQAALAHLEQGDFATAGALIRLTGRYVTRIGEEKGQTFGEVVPFPAIGAEVREGRALERTALPPLHARREGPSTQAAWVFD